MLKQNAKIFCLLSALGLGVSPVLGQARSSTFDARADMKIIAIVNVLCAWMAGATQVESFEKQSISSVQKMSASELDEALPDRPFANWFNETIGTDAGVVWQLTQCGEQITAPGETEQDQPACAEITAYLLDKRRVYVAISIGTFKKGLTGKPSFFLAVIEQNEQLYPVRRLSGLPEMLRAPADPSATGAKNRIADPPAIKMDSVWFITPFRYQGPMFASVQPVTGDLSQAEEPEPPPSTQALEQVPESVLLSRAITKVNPAYPPTAKKMKATGIIEVEIIISEMGLVVEATAISGHLALRNAAEEAARKWVFEPAILNGAPVRVKSVLTFVLGPSAK
jgi:TonB family protein